MPVGEGSLSRRSRLPNSARFPRLRSLNSAMYTPVSSSLCWMHISTLAPSFAIMVVWGFRRHRQEYKVCAVVPRSPCRGGPSCPPRTPPRASRKARLRSWRRLAKGCVQPGAGIEPFRLMATSRRCITTRETAALPWNPSGKGLPHPFANHGQDFRILDHDRCFGTGFEPREMSSLPSQTHRPGMALPGPSQEARMRCRVPGHKPFRARGMRAVCERRMALLDEA